MPYRPPPLATAREVRLAEEYLHVSVTKFAAKSAVLGTQCEGKDANAAAKCKRSKKNRATQDGPGPIVNIFLTF